MNSTAAPRRRRTVTVRLTYRGAYLVGLPKTFDKIHGEILAKLPDGSLTFRRNDGTVLDLPRHMIAYVLD